MEMVAASVHLFCLVHKRASGHYDATTFNHSFPCNKRRNTYCRQIPRMEMLGPAGILMCNMVHMCLSRRWTGVPQQPPFQPDSQQSCRCIPPQETILFLRRSILVPTCPMVFVGFCRNFIGLLQKNDKLHTIEILCNNRSKYPADAICIQFQT